MNDIILLCQTDNTELNWFIQIKLIFPSTNRSSQIRNIWMSGCCLDKSMIKPIVPPINRLAVRPAVVHSFLRLSLCVRHKQTNVPPTRTNTRTHSTVSESSSNRRLCVRHSMSAISTSPCTPAALFFFFFLLVGADNESCFFFGGAAAAGAASAEDEERGNASELECDSL